MTVLTNHEQQEIDRANTQGKQPVVFVHGLWLLASSWDNWRALFEEQGYTTLAPGWPDDPEAVAEANDDPEGFARKRIKQVTDNYADAIRPLKRKPAVIGDSFGGLIAQQLADEGLYAWTAADHRGRERPYGPVDGRHGCLQVAAQQSRGHGVPRNPGSRALPDY